MGRNATARLYYGCEPITLAGTTLVANDVWNAARGNDCDCVCVGRGDSDDDWGESYALGYLAESALECAEEIDLAGLGLFERALDETKRRQLQRAMDELNWPAANRKLAWRLAAHYG